MNLASPNDITHHDVHNDHNVKLRTTRRKRRVPIARSAKRRDRRVRRGE